MGNLTPQEKGFSLERILKASNLSKEQFDSTNLKEVDLENIFNDYLKLQDVLLDVAQLFVNRALTFKKVHSVRYRIKNEDHLIAKVIRKKLEDTAREINVLNYKEEIKDLVGVRILYLFKIDFPLIDDAIRTNFNISDGEKPVKNIRNGDEEKEDNSFQIRIHKRGYRSVHYIVESTPAKIKHLIEIQVRTIFEEGWSEVDHELLYPNNTENLLLDEFSMVLNTLSGGADAMSSVMNNLVKSLYVLNEDHANELSIKDEKINALQDKINKSNMTKVDKQNAKELLNTKFSTKDFSASISKNGRGISMAEMLGNQEISGMGGISLAEMMGNQGISGMGGISLAEMMGNQRISGMGGISLAEMMGNQRISGMGSISLAEMMGNQGISNMTMATSLGDAVKKNISILPDKPEIPEIAKAMIKAGTIKTNIGVSKKPEEKK